ncbi:MAG: hypothetical protein OQK09_12150 [Colwellia sp.]|nr:hypothetical protein [Colwellia sp.]MCW8864509.1 hypothetical protein [Colwellia sp.]MCW9082255.1 hypothetical protein [Colwellia sp.]
MQYTAKMTVDLEENKSRDFEVSSSEDFREPEVLNSFSAMLDKLTNKFNDLSREEILSFITARADTHHHERLLFDVCHDCAEVRLITTGEKPIVIKDEFHSIDFFIDIASECIRIYKCNFFAFIVDDKKQEQHMINWY